MVLLFSRTNAQTFGRHFAAFIIPGNCPQYLWIKFYFIAVAMCVTTAIAEACHDMSMVALLVELSLGPIANRLLNLVSLEYHH